MEAALIPQSPLRKTPLHAKHLALGGRMVDFAGWSMPVQYDGVLKEHERVRQSAGLFDVSHMGEFLFQGAGAQSTLDKLATNNVAKMNDGQALYTALCNENGGVRDDALIYRLGPTRFMMVVNASNTDKVAAWCQEHLADETAFVDRTSEVALLALQGPASRDILRQCQSLGELTRDLEELGYYHFTGSASTEEVRILSRTGYTGELGYEIYWSGETVTEIWDELLQLCQLHGAGPAGLAARDTLRFEVGYCLYGHELEEDISPLEAGIGWTVKMKKPFFIGQEALRRQKSTGIPRKLVGLELEHRAIARQGFEVVASQQLVGRVTSGTFSPSLQKSLCMALIDRASADAKLGIRVRGKVLPAKRVTLPFYKPE